MSLMVASLFVDNVIAPLWSRLVTNEHPLNKEESWKTSVIRCGEHLYVPLRTRIQWIYTINELRKPHKQSENPSAENCTTPVKNLDFKL